MFVWPEGGFYNALGCTGTFNNCFWARPSHVTASGRGAQNKGCHSNQEAWYSGGKSRSFHQKPCFILPLWETALWFEEPTAAAVLLFSCWVWNRCLDSLLFFTVLDFLRLINLLRACHSRWASIDSRSQGEEKREGNGPQLQPPSTARARKPSLLAFIPSPDNSCNWPCQA